MGALIACVALMDAVREDYGGRHSAWRKWMLRVEVAMGGVDRVGRSRVECVSMGGIS